MKKLFYILLVLIFFPYNALAARTYSCTCLTGGTTGCLDTLDITATGSPNAVNLGDGDLALVATITGSVTSIRHYVFDADGTDAEDTTDYTIIRPDDYSSGGVWIEAYPDIAYESDCSDNTEGLCIDMDDFKLYRYNGSAMVEYGTGTLDTDYDGDLSDETPEFSTVTASQFVGLTIGDCTDGDTCTADEILDDENISPSGGAWDLSNLTIILPPGGFFFADENTSPDMVGQFKYDNVDTGWDDGVLQFYDDDEIKDILMMDSTEVLASGDDNKVVRYNWNGGQGYLDLVDNHESIGIACSDETTDLTTGTAKVTFRMPFAMTVTDVRANVNTAPTGATITVDINEDGTTILGTKLTIDATEKTSTTAATPHGFSDTALADDAEITIDIDQIGSATAGKGLKVWLIGVK
jgi:hypothetical protein